MLIRDVLTRNARIHGDRIALVREGESVTYRALAERVSGTVSALRVLGMGKGDRIAVLTRDPVSCIELVYAVTQVGAVMVPINDLLVPRELTAILAHAEASALLFESKFRDTVERIRPRLPSVGKFVCIDRAVPGYESIREFGSEARGLRADAVPLAESDIAIQAYTDGDSGIPMGAMLSHRNLLSASWSAALEMGLSRNDVCLPCVPLPFMAGTGRLLRFQLLGGTTVFPARYGPEEILAEIERRKVTHVVLATAMMERILGLPEPHRYDISSLRTVVCGCASIPAETRKRALRFFGCGMILAYGHVESSGVLTFLPIDARSPDDVSRDARHLASVGKEAIGVEVRIFDGNGAEAAKNTVGELVARGPNIFEGYFRDPSSTAEVVRNGWFHTGDIASVDDEGYICIVDRKRETLTVGGIPVCPREIEEILSCHPAVMEAAVIGRHDDARGEVPVAVIALKEGMAADAKSILSHCRENLAPFKIPASIEFVAGLPRNAQGKILKARLKGKVVADATRRTPRR